LQASPWKNTALRTCNLISASYGAEIKGEKIMENKLEIFKNEEFGIVRTVIIEGEPWFVLKDVCNALEIGNSSDVNKRIEKGDLDIIDLADSLGRIQKTTILNEYGLYDCVLLSRKPEAKKFKRWITHDVIPQIRKQGLYATDNFVDMALNNPENMIRILKAYESEKKAKKEAKLKLEEKTLQLDENKKWFTIKRVASLNHRNWRLFNWKKLKNTSDYLGIEVKKIFDANYGNVNAYHIDVWRHEYPGMCFENSQ
jgi:prophage antirepressor-like protein